MVWLGAVLGLRWGEVAGLTVGDIDFLRGEVIVTRQLGRDRQLSQPKLQPDGGASPRRGGCWTSFRPCSRLAGSLRRTLTPWSL